MALSHQTSEINVSCYTESHAYDIISLIYSILQNDDIIVLCCSMKLVFDSCSVIFGAQNYFVHCQIEDYNYTQIFLFEQKTNF